MLNIIHASTSTCLTRSLRDQTSSTVCIVLPQHERDAAWSEVKRLGLSEIALDEIMDQEQIVLEKAYINLVSELGSRLHSVEWWANSLSEKNEHGPNLFRDLVLFHRFVKTLDRHRNSDLSLIVICHPDLASQLADFCRKNAIAFKSLENSLLFSFRTLAAELTAFLNRAYVLANLAFRMFLIDRSFRSRIVQELSAKRFYVIRTWLDSRFGIGSDSSSLPFFGKLPAYVTREGHKLLVLAGIIDHYRKMIGRIANFNDYLVVPEEHFLSFFDLLKFIPRLSVKQSKLNDTVLFIDLDVTVLFEKELNRGLRSPAHLRNIIRYHIAKRFAEEVSFSHYIHTFENYAWEKMMILGIRRSGAHGRILGFQHAFISRNSFKYFPGESELNIMPIPDRIISRGEITRNIMLTYGHYDPSVISIGCALRQEYLHHTAPYQRKRHRKILVPLTMVPEESSVVLKTLASSGLSGSDIKIVIRCHPLAPFSSFKKYVRHAIPSNFTFNNEKDVDDELSTTDMVIYTWTTIAFEAVKMGVPVIYLDVLRPLYVDPLFECNFFKRTAINSDELLHRIEEIYALDDATFNKELSSAQEYLKKDFYPVTSDNLAPFYAA